MKILLCHNYYRQAGGEDQVFSDELHLLRSHGHEVLTWTEHNDSTAEMSRWEVGRKTLWNTRSHAHLRRLVRQERPQIVHFTNTFPLISPAAYYAARSEGAAVVQSLHNYRLLCPGALLMRDGKACEDCLGKLFAWPSIKHGCYRESRAATGIVATMLTTHRILRTWRKQIDSYIALTDFARQKFIQGGLPEKRIAVKPNFLGSDPGPGSGRGGYAVFVGRLSSEKGAQVLLESWKRLGRDFKLKIVGDGPLAEQVRSAAAADARIEWLGWQLPTDVLRLIGEAAFVIAPSLCYEGFPKVVVESFAKGTPLVVSRLGSLAELVEHGRTGLLFKPGDADDLAEQTRRLIDRPTECEQMRAAAREEFVSKYTADQNYEALRAIYAQALRSGRPRAASVCGGRQREHYYYCDP